MAEMDKRGATWRDATQLLWFENGMNATLVCKTLNKLETRRFCFRKQKLETNAFQFVDS